MEEFDGPEELIVKLFSAGRSIGHFLENVLTEELTDVTSKPCDLVTGRLNFSNTLKFYSISQLTVFKE